MPIVELSSENFQEEVMNSDLPVLVDFYAEWCGPCKMISPIIDELAETYSGKIKVGKLDIDQASSIASAQGVMSIPTIIFFKNGEKVEENTGALDKGQLEELIQKVIGE